MLINIYVKNGSANHSAGILRLLWQIDCEELRQTSPLSHVIPPHCRTVIPLVFESTAKGRFQRFVRSDALIVQLFVVDAVSVY